MVLERGLSYDQLPEWQRERSSSNIRSHYRSGGSYTECIKSLFWFHQIHNEFWNAWTMIITNIIGAILISNTLMEYYPVMSDIDRFIFILFWIHGMVHLPFSVGNHLFDCINPEIAEKWHQYDFKMICISADILTFILSFYVFPIWFTCILTMIGIFATYKVFDIIQHVHRDRAESTGYVGIHVLLYALPVIYQSMVELFNDNNKESGAFYCFLGMAISLSIGAFTFAYEFPQRYSKSGRFDRFLNGHNIMHFGVAGAYLSEFTFLCHMTLSARKESNIALLY